jgi:hypothetical protein
MEELVLKHAKYFWNTTQKRLFLRCTNIFLKTTKCPRTKKKATLLNVNMEEQSTIHCSDTECVQKKKKV